MVFPVRKIRDEVFTDFDGQIFAGVSIETTPLLDLLEFNQADWEQLLPPLFYLGLSCASDLRLYPFTCHALFGQHEKQLIVQSNCLIDLGVELSTALHIFRRVPDAQLVGLQM